MNFYNKNESHISPPIAFALEYAKKCISCIRDDDDRTEAYIHVYEVSQFCKLLAYTRNENSELATIAGLLHDCYRHSSGISHNHAIEGAVLVEKVLKPKKSLFDPKEIEQICQMISRHSEKKVVHDPLDEILKDADVLSHYIASPFSQISNEENWRLTNTLYELIQKNNS